MFVKRGLRLGALTRVIVQEGFTFLQAVREGQEDIFREIVERCPGAIAMALEVESRHRPPRCDQSRDRGAPCMIMKRIRARLLRCRARLIAAKAAPLQSRASLRVTRRRRDATLLGQAELLHAFPHSSAGGWAHRLFFFTRSHLSHM